MKKCPFCAEQVQDAAIVCRFCHADLAANTPNTIANIDAVAQQATKGGLKMIAKVIIGAALIVVAGIIGLIALGGMLTPTGSTGSLKLSVLIHRGSAGLRVTNDTAIDWKTCTFAIAGGYSVYVNSMAPHESVEVYYKDFMSGQTPLNTDDGYARALRSTAIECYGPDTNQYRVSE